MSADGTGGVLAFVRRYIRFGNLEKLTKTPTIERFDIVGLFTALISGLVLVVWTGIAGWVGAIGQAAENGAAWVVRAQSSLINAVFGVDRVVTLAVGGTQVEISRAGIAAFALALAVVGVAAYIANLGVEQLEQ